MAKTLLQPTVGRRLRALRDHARLTRAQLSKQTGVPISAIARLERGGNVRLSTYLPILNYFAVRDARTWMLAQTIAGLPAARRAELLASLECDGAAHE